MNADLPNFKYVAGLTFPVNLLSKMFKKLRPLSGWKLKGKVPFMELLDKSKFFNDGRNEMGLILLEILQLD
jgi:hypothetical protein